MYGLNAFALVAFGVINVLAYRLSRQAGPAGRRVVRILCRVLLGGNLLRYAVIYPLVLGEVNLPVEFSTVSYFLVPMFLLMGKKKSWAAYSGLMAGFFYYMAMILAGGLIYGNSNPLDVYISMFCHGMLYFCGFYTIAAERCTEHEPWKLLLGVGGIALRAALLRPLVPNDSHLLIYILLDAQAVRQVLPARTWPVALPVYYALILGALILSTRGFFRRSETMYRKFSALRAPQT